MDCDESFCARCARHIRNCCQVPDVYVSPGDRERIASFTGRDDFFEFRQSSDPSYFEQQHDPAWSEYVVQHDGSRRILKHTAHGDCTFLGPQGCILPTQVRPLVCRLYPFHYTEEGISQQLVPGCPVELLRPGQDLIQVLNMSLEEARVWHRQLYEEIRWEKASLCELV